MGQEPADDRTLAARVAAQDAGAVADLLARCHGAFDGAHAALRAAVPTCRLPLPCLLPHAARAVAHGFLAAPPGGPAIDAHARALHLRDVLVAAACLAGDAGAGEWLRGAVQTRVRPLLLQRWARRAGGAAVDRVAEELPGHCLVPPAAGDAAGPARLALYRGAAALPTWLFAVAVNCLRDGLRQATREPGGLGTEGEPAATAGEQPENRALLAEAGRAGDRWRGRLVGRLRAAFGPMPPRRRLVAALHWVHGLTPSEVAEKLSVSRPAVSQQIELARQDLLAAGEEVVGEIAAEVGRDAAAVRTMLFDGLPSLLAGSGEPAEGAA